MCGQSGTFGNRICTGSFWQQEGIVFFPLLICFLAYSLGLYIENFQEFSLWGSEYARRPWHASVAALTIVAFGYASAYLFYRCVRVTIWSYRIDGRTETCPRQEYACINGVTGFLAYCVGIIHGSIIWFSEGVYKVGSVVGLLLLSICCCCCCLTCVR